MPYIPFKVNTVEPRGYSIWTKMSTQRKPPQGRGPPDPRHHHAGSALRSLRLSQDCRVAAC